MDNTFLDEFLIESEELLEEAEDALLAIENGNSDIDENFNKIFRSFHSLKGAAGMMGLDSLQKHMHLLEDSFEAQRGDYQKLKNTTDHFLKGVDAARRILAGEEGLNFSEMDASGSDNSVPVNSKKSSLNLSNHLEFILSKRNLKLDVLSEGRELDHILDELESVITLNKVKDVELYLKKKQFLLSDALIVDRNYLEKLKKIGKGKVANIYFGDFAKEKLDQSTLLVVNEKTTEEEILQKISSLRIINEYSRALDKAIQLVMYQYTDIEEYLVKNNRELAKETLKSEISKLIKIRDEVFR